MRLQMYQFILNGKYKMKKLSKKESNQLLGGETTHYDGDVKNTNGTNGCKCIYDNSPSAITNINSVDQCVCKCKIFNK